MGNLSTKLDQKPLHITDFSSYEDACNSDPDVKKFDFALQLQTGKVLHALANGVDQYSLSFNSLKEVTTTLLEMDQEVVKVILDYKEDVWKNPDLFQLVEDFFDNTLATLEFCTAADKSIKTARDNQLIVQMAFNLMPSDRKPTESESERILKELSDFRKSGNPFNEEFVQKFKAVQERHMQMLEKLLEKKRRLDKKLRTVRVWAKVSSIMFAAMVAAVLICSVVAAAMAAPPIAGALAAASSFPLGSLGKWVKSLWSGYENEIKAQLQVVHGMHMGSFVAIKDLDTIRTLVDKLQTQMTSMIFDIEFSDERKDPIALQMAVEEIAKKREHFVKELDELEEHIDRCGKHIRQARAIVLQRIMRRTQDRGKRPSSF